MKNEHAGSCSDSVPVPAADRNDERGAKSLRPAFALGPWEVGELDRNDQRLVMSAEQVICTCWHHCLGSLEAQMEANAQLIATAPELREALMDLVDIIDRAGLLNLSNGVQLGQTSWYVKASDRLEYARRILQKAENRS